MAVYTETEKRLSRQDPLTSEEYVVKAMPSILGSFDMTAIYIMIVFYITNVCTAVNAGAAAFTYLLLGGVLFCIPCVIATAQLGALFPHEGSLYNWTHKAFGGYWSFFVAFCAWFPGVLVMVTAADNVMAYMQGLNSNWFIEPWQQGLVIMGVIILSGVIAVQRFRMVQNVINVAACTIFVAVFLLAIGSAVWLAKGHAPATSFTKLSDWSPNGGNIAVFGLVILAYLGTETPLNMGGELINRRVVTRHLLWGTLLVFVGYFVAAFAVLVVEGPANGSSLSSFIAATDATLGKLAGNFVALFIMGFFLLSAVAYNYAYARLLLVAGIDQRLPVSVGRLNRNRVPANAILFQTIVAAVLAGVIFIGAPLFVHIGQPLDLANQVYNVMLASSTLVWATSASFLFFNLLVFYFRDRRAFRAQLIFPSPVIWISIIFGVASCLFAIVDSVVNSWTPLIGNQNWWYIVGGLTLFCLIIAAIGSMFASSEADWQSLSK